MVLTIFNTYMNFFRHHFCCFTVAPLFILDKSMAWNRSLQHTCFKNLCKIAQASKNSDSMLFALPSYQFPYIVMNSCLYLTPLVDPFHQLECFEVQWLDVGT